MMRKHESPTGLVNFVSKNSARQKQSNKKKPNVSSLQVVFSSNILYEYRSKDMLNKEINKSYVQPKGEMLSGLE